MAATIDYNVEVSLKAELQALLKQRYPEMKDTPSIWITSGKGYRSNQPGYYKAEVTYSLDAISHWEKPKAGGKDSWYCFRDWKD